MDIQAAILHDAGTKFSIESLTLDMPQQGEVLVRIVACGVCHSDYHVATGTTQHPMPCICGHEGAGVVEAIGSDVTRVEVGDHVTLSWTPDCGQCFYCLRGQPNLCETYTDPIWAGTMLDGTTRVKDHEKPVYIYCGLGTFSDHIVVPQQSCIPIRKDVPLKVASLVGCAVATGVGAAMYTTQVRPGDSVVVFGCGGVGLNILQGAALCGAQTIIAVDVNQAKMDLAREFGATHTILSDYDEAGVIREIRKMTGGRGVDHAFEAVGIPALQELALEAVRPGGMVVFAGLAPMGSATNLPGAILTRTEKTVKGSYYGSVNPSRDFPMLIDLYMAGKLKLDELVSAEYRLDQINKAYDAMLGGEAARGIIVF